MKTINLIALLSLVTLNVFAADYSTMTITEMQAMRGSVPVEDRAAFQAEMQTRVQAMTVEERQTFQASMKQNKFDLQNATGLKVQNKTQTKIQTQTMQPPMQNIQQNTVRQINQGR